jgi:taurine dioxygenase
MVDAMPRVRSHPRAPEVAPGGGDDGGAAATPDLLLDAAEALIADLGVDAVSVRAVNAAAGRNPAAVHYHFGSKDALVRGVLERRMAAIGAHRTALLSVLDRHARPQIRGVADAIVRPLAVVVLHEPWGPTYVRFLASLTTGERRWRTLIGEAFAPQWACLEPVLIRSVPDAPPPVLRYRYEIVAGGHTPSPGRTRPARGDVRRRNRSMLGRRRGVDRPGVRGTRRSDQRSHSMTATNMASRATTLDVVPISGVLGAEVRGIDLRTVDDATWAEVYALWLDYQVLFFPGQDLTPADHVALGRRFGEPEIHPFIEKLSDEYPEIVVLDSATGTRADTWHTDVTFSPTPPMASVLRMAVCPPVGGDTMWSNQYRAYETLSAPIRDLIDGLSVWHSAASFGHPESKVAHPAVRIHPETGRRSLFVNRQFTSHFVELRRSESATLLDYLCSWSEQPSFQCRYRWTPGAVAIWDNRCTQHYAVNDYRERRVIERVTVLGDVPAGPAPRWPEFVDTLGGFTGGAYGERNERRPRPLDERQNSLVTP